MKYKYNLLGSGNFVKIGRGLGTFVIHLLRIFNLNECASDKVDIIRCITNMVRNAYVTLR